MSGFVGNLSRKQESNLNKLKENLRDIWCDDFNSDVYLLRWLRARNFSIEKSEKMLRAHRIWRTKNNMDTILQDYERPEVLKKYYQGGFCGHDKEGSPTWFDPIGLNDPKGLAKSVSAEEVLRMKMWYLERTFRVLLPQRSEEEGKPITQIVIIFDLTQFGMKHLWKPAMDVFCDILAMAEANFPELMKKTYIINAPAFFPIVFSIVKPFLHEETVRKVEIHRSNYRAALLKQFDAAQLPVKYGGTMVDSNGDPSCSLHICYAGTVPDTYYIQDITSDDKEEIIVLHGSSASLEYSIPEAGTLLRCEYNTAEHDIGVGIYRKANTSESKSLRSALEEIIPSRRVSAHLTVQTMELTCDRPGMYVVRFDNSYSWHRDKRVTYRVTIEQQGKIIQNCLADTNITVENEKVEEIRGSSV